MRSRETVLIEIKSAVEGERASTLRVLHLLREVESDQHYLSLGYPSLFEFATRELGYSAGGAHRRISAMRLMKIIPEAEKDIENGLLSLCVAAKTQSFFRQEDRRRSEQGKMKLPLERKREIVRSMIGLTKYECEKELVKISPESALPHEVTRPIAEGKSLVQFVASDELLGKLERLKGLLAHQNYGGKYEKLFEILADIALRKLDPKERLLPPVEVERRSRYIPTSIRDAVRRRDGDRCTFVDPESGRRCESRHGIQFDHQVPYSRGGLSTVDNLRLRCGAHNRYTAEKEGLLRPPGFDDSES